MITRPMHFMLKSNDLSDIACVAQWDEDGRSVEIRVGDDEIVMDYATLMDFAKAMIDVIGDRPGT